jgi:hypothetical protein
MCNGEYLTITFNIKLTDLLSNCEVTPDIIHGADNAGAGGSNTTKIDNARLAVASVSKESGAKSGADVASAALNPAAIAAVDVPKNPAGAPPDSRDTNATNTDVASAALNPAAIAAVDVPKNPAGAPPDSRDSRDTSGAPAAAAANNESGDGAENPLLAAIRKGTTLKKVAAGEGAAPSTDAPGAPPKKTAFAGPKNTELPAISEKGGILTVTDGTWKDPVTPKFTYQWIKGNKNLDTETNNKYVIKSADIPGQQIKCRVRATNNKGEITFIESIPYVVPGPPKTASPPINSTKPTISGTPEVGQQLTVVHGKYSVFSLLPPPTLTHQWQRDNTDIPSATKNTYTIVQDDVGKQITCVETATNSEGGVTTTPSNPTTPVVDPGAPPPPPPPPPPPGVAPKNTTKPEITGTARVGEKLEISNGTWDGSPTRYTYQWKKNNTVMPSETSSGYVIDKADIGEVFTCDVTAVNESGQTTVTSDPTSKVVDAAPAPAAAAAAAPVPPAAAPKNTAKPKITGKAEVGQNLSVDPSEGWEDTSSLAITVQWQSNGMNLPHGSSTTYKIVQDDVGKKITCNVTAENESGQTTVTSDPTSKVVDAAPAPAPAPAPAAAAAAAQNKEDYVEFWNRLWNCLIDPTNSKKIKNTIDSDNFVGSLNACATKDVDPAKIEIQHTEILTKFFNTLLIASRNRNAINLRDSIDITGNENDINYQLLLIIIEKLRVDNIEKSFPSLFKSKMFFDFLKNLTGTIGSNDASFMKDVSKEYNRIIDDPAATGGSLKSKSRSKSNKNKKSKSSKRKTKKAASSKKKKIKFIK